MSGTLAAKNTIHCQFAVKRFPPACPIAKLKVSRLRKLFSGAGLKVD